jgi:hypothetical protein
MILWLFKQRVVAESVRIAMKFHPLPLFGLAFLFIWSFLIFANVERIKPFFF